MDTDRLEASLSLLVNTIDETMLIHYRQAETSLWVIGFTLVPTQPPPPSVSDTTSSLTVFHMGLM